MKRLLVGVGATLLAFSVTACGDDTSDIEQKAIDAAASMTPPSLDLDPGDSSQSKNERGAIEAPLGEPIEVRDGDQLIIKITDTRLVTTDCEPYEPATPDITNAKLAATIEVGAAEMTEWLWKSDFYYVGTGRESGKPETVQNVTLSTEDESFGCTGTEQFIDVPPNSTRAGSVGLSIPTKADAIGYSLDLGQIQQRIEWTLPENWAAAI